jgi:hypothetical protein
MKAKLFGLIAGSFLFIVTSQAHAAVFDINLTGLGTTSSLTPGCYCSPVELYVSPIFNLPPGNTYNFGTGTLPYILAGFTQDAGPYQSTTYFTGNVEFGNLASASFGEDPRALYLCGYGPGAGPGSPQTPCDPPPPIVVSLLYSTGGNVQVAFWAGDYMAPTPLPAALPLFATGLGALGLLGWRRKWKNTAALASKLARIRYLGRCLVSYSGAGPSSARR